MIKDASTTSKTVKNFLSLYQSKEEYNNQERWLGGRTDVT